MNIKLYRTPSITYFCWGQGGVDPESDQASGLTYQFTGNIGDRGNDKKKKKNNIKGMQILTVGNWRKQRKQFLLLQHNQKWGWGGQKERGIHVSMPQD